MQKDNLTCDNHAQNVMKTRLYNKSLPRSAKFCIDVMVREVPLVQNYRFCSIAFVYITILREAKLSVK